MGADGEVRVAELPPHTSREAVMEMMLCAGEVRGWSNMTGRT